MGINRIKSRLVKRVVALFLVAAISTGLEACWNLPNAQDSALVGASAGALIGGAFGCGFANQFGGKGGDAQDYAIGCGAGVAGGALVGGLVGYLMWGPPPEKWQAPVPPPPPPPPPPAAAAPPPVKEKITLRGVHFDFNKATVRPGDAAILDEAASELKAHPKVQVDVNGYCDSIGSDAYNLKLSEKRAEAVTTYLVEAGIAQNRLIPHGYGKTDFIASNDTSEGRVQNRRVELVPVN
jgi:OmpA-OmpF porin, OOP family